MQTEASRTETDCAHPRCARADEGLCLVVRAARILEIEAALCGSVQFRAEDDGERYGHIWALFARPDDALSFRDSASLRLAEAGLGYFSPAVTKGEGVWQVAMVLADRASEVG